MSNDKNYNISVMRMDEIGFYVTDRKCLTIEDLYKQKRITRIEFDSENRFTQPKNVKKIMEKFIEDTLPDPELSLKWDPFTRNYQWKEYLLELFMKDNRHGNTKTP